MAVKDIFIGIIVGIIFIIFLIKFGDMPDEYALYPDKSKADIMLQNEVHDMTMNTSELVFMLQTSFGVCNNIGSVRIVKTGDIGICTNSGWKIHQPDQ